ncbi:MAG TPA: thiolase domain-containing protein [archaeon]|nr:thiolase domain-containing protein [archaeon]
MAEAAIIGAGMTPVTSGSGRTLSELFVTAAKQALDEAGVDEIDSIYVGNMMSGFLQKQEHLGALMATALGQEGVSTYKVEAACASGGVAVNAAVKALLSGLEEIVLVGAVEKMSGYTTPEVTTGLMMAEDRMKVASTGVTFVGLNAMIARAYMHEYGITHESIAQFPVLCHKNALDNPNAQFRKKIGVQDVLQSPLVADPLRLFDCSGIGDGAAALVLAPKDMAKKFNDSPVEIAASTVASDTLSLYQRPKITTFEASKRASNRAYKLAGIKPEDVDALEVHDAFSVLGVMAIEDLGFAEKGAGTHLLDEGECERDGRLPTNSFGGLKARGHPVGASGVYQIAELAMQLENKAGKCQVSGARIGLAQSVGGIGSTVAVHILRAMN